MANQTSLIIDILNRQPIHGFGGKISILSNCKFVSIANDPMKREAAYLAEVLKIEMNMIMMAVGTFKTSRKRNLFIGE